MKLLNISTPTYPNTFTMVDDEDYERLNKYKWCPLVSKKIGSNLLYARRRNKNSYTLIHWEIYGEKCLIDHIDGNTLNNQKANLRKATVNQNNRSSKKTHRKCTSKYKGVHWAKREQKYIVQIWIDGGKRLYIGGFTNERDAAIAYDESAIKYHGEYAVLNILKNPYERSRK